MWSLGQWLSPGDTFAGIPGPPGQWARSGVIFGFHTVVWYWHRAGRGQGCTKHCSRPGQPTRHVSALKVRHGIHADPPFLLLRSPACARVLCAKRGPAGRRHSCEVRWGPHSRFTCPSLSALSAPQVKAGGMRGAFAAPPGTCPAEPGARVGAGSLAAGEAPALHTKHPVLPALSPLLGVPGGAELRHPSPLCSLRTSRKPSWLTRALGGQEASALFGNLPLRRQRPARG